MFSASVVTIHLTHDQLFSSFRRENSSQPFYYCRSGGGGAGGGMAAYVNALNILRPEEHAGTLTVFEPWIFFTVPVPPCVLLASILTIRFFPPPLIQGGSHPALTRFGFGPATRRPTAHVSARFY